MPLRAMAADDAIARRCDAHLSALARLGRFSGTVEMRREGEVLFRGAYGTADVARNVPCTNDTQFQIASLSKMFTAFAVLKARDRGALRLEDPICRHVDSCPAQWGQVTIGQLLHHTSGIPDYEEALGLGSPAYMSFMREPDSSQRILARQRPLPLDFAPGTKFHYSSTGYIILGTIVQRAARMPLGTLLRRTVFDPCGMRDTGTIGLERPPRLAQGYEAPDIPWPQLLAGFRLGDVARAVAPLSLTPPAGDAGLFSTAGDLMRWNDRMLHPDGKVMTAALAREIIDGGAFGYGAGWVIGTDDARRRRFRHTGELPGYLSVSTMYPDDGLTFAILTNFTRSRLSQIALALVAFANGKPYDPPASGNVVALTDMQRAALVGQYRFADGDVMTVAPDPLGLSAAIPKRYTAGLIPLSPTRFYFPLADGTMTFALGADGRASSVNARYSSTDHVAERITDAG